jgi:LAO/AO transport system kinase
MNIEHDNDGRGSHEQHSGAEVPGDTVNGSEGRLGIRPGIETPANTMQDAKRRHARVLDIEEHVRGILQGDRVVLGKTITLIESMKAEHHRKALDVMTALLPHTGNAIRIGITGAPGVGKSTFIEALGVYLCDTGHTVAVLAIDPSSQISSGSIMGDKTRMEKLSVHNNAFIRPSPSAGSLGGVANKTREAMLLCEAAGFDVVIIETVGVGQSETMVHSMVDCFLLLQLAGAGDHLQGIKRGIMELADMLAITKADGANTLAAEHARSEYENALHLMKYPVPEWRPPVLTCSALEGTGIAMLWENIERFAGVMKERGHFQQKRRDQALSWLHDTIRQSLHDRFFAHQEVSQLLDSMQQKVADGEIPPLLAAHKLLETFFGADGTVWQ